MPPAARLTDMHVCPMQTPAVVPIPHVGGPIVSPGAPTVLIGNLPAARITDMCVCVGPPDVIVRGSAGVYILNLNAARIGDNTAHGGVIVQGWPTVIIGEIGVVTPSPPKMPALPGVSIPKVPELPQMPAAPEMPAITAPDAGLLATMAKAILGLAPPTPPAGPDMRPTPTPQGAVSPATAAPAVAGATAAPPAPVPPAQAAAAAASAIQAARQTLDKLADAPASPLADIAVPTLQSLGDALGTLPAGTLPPDVQAALDDLRAGIAEARSAYQAASARIEELKALAQQKIDEAKGHYDRLMAEKRRAEAKLAEGRDTLYDAVERYEATRAELKRQVDEAQRLGKALSQEARSWADRKPPSLPKVR